MVKAPIEFHYRHHIHDEDVCARCTNSPRPPWRVVYPSGWAIFVCPECHAAIIEDLEKSEQKAKG